MLDNFNLANPATFMVLALLVGFGAVAAAKVYGLFFMRWKTPHRVGSQMENARAEVTEWGDSGEGYVLADGELWRAKSDASLAPGDDVVVTAVDGLELTVRKK